MRHVLRVFAWTRRRILPPCTHCGARVEGLMGVAGTLLLPRLLAAAGDFAAPSWPYAYPGGHSPSVERKPGASNLHSLGSQRSAGNSTVSTFSPFMLNTSTLIVPIPPSSALLLARIPNYDQAASWSGHGATHTQQVALNIHQDNLQTLAVTRSMAHMPGTP